nr:MAG TPA: zipper dimerization domain transcription factor-like protein [Caudoviricetes sp.]
MNENVPLGVGDLSSRYTPISTYQALETRVKALEAKLSNQ